MNKMKEMEESGPPKSKNTRSLLLEQNLPILIDIIPTVILLFECIFFSLLISDNHSLFFPLFFMIWIFFT